ncbi:uncharacterized protein LOC114542746 [Dendronephthya gigantea]|uniref:uncharacterized protein LOC114542746 n=1 Tax=Dendronephthya gigantea TaxID=151771 RepID=UPI00106A4CBC|nr:uncharacterized protein LOC114542746 [Dendronephthya gigantea]
MAESEECAGSSLCVDSITVNTCLKKGMKRCSGCGLEQGIAKKVCKNQGCSLRFPTKEKNLDALKNMSNPNITQQRKHMEKRADILNIHNNCDIVILMHHKHGSGDTLTFYGTEGAGVSFIGNKSTIETSEGGRVALNLFRKFIEAPHTKDKVNSKIPWLWSKNYIVRQLVMNNGPLRLFCAFLIFAPLSSFL